MSICDGSALEFSRYHRKIQQISSTTSSAIHYVLITSAKEFVHVSVVFELMK